MRLRISIVIILILFAAHATGSPARRGRMMLTQPDGTSFISVFNGDEFTKIKTTAEGHAIMQNADGWWCYAIYEDNGTRTCSGWKVGEDAPLDVLAQSRNIPHRTLSENAKTSRARAGFADFMGTPMKRMLKGIGESKASGKTKHGIVILAQFQDIHFIHSKEDFEAMLSQPGYSRHGATGSAMEYFEDQFGGRIGFEFDVSEIVTLKNRREYYGGNNSNGDDTHPADLIIGACRLADERGLDFSKYDDDSDGIVDNVFVFFAGEDEAEGGDENCIWSHAWYLMSGAQKTLRLDGCLIDRYACSSEMTRIYGPTGRLESTRLSGIGTFCHEYSHTFGLPDMYDTDYDAEGGWAAGLWGSTSLMDSGNQNNHGNTPPNFNAVERELLGISDPVRIRRDGTYSMGPVNVDGEYYSMITDRSDEYYLFECRSTDQKWDAHIGGSGMLVYHIDRTDDMLDRWQTLNTVNADASHQCADLVEADGRRDSFSGVDDYLSRKGNTKGIFFPYNDVNSLPAAGTPGLNFWNGDEGRLSITGIRLNAEGRVEFSVTGESDETTPPSVRSHIETDVFCDGAIISFESNREFDGEAVVSYGLTGQDTTTVRIVPYRTSRYAIRLEGLDPARTYTVTMYFTMNGLKGKETSISFMTKKAPAFDWPYIQFGSARRNDNGTFLHDSRIPLKVINARDAKEIRWTYNDLEIKTEPDHYYTLRSSGILKAYITREDGSEDVVVKEITLSPLTAQ